MNREELNWLLQTIKGRQDREAFRVSAVQARKDFLAGDGRCSPGTGMDQSQPESIIDHGSHHLTEYATPELSKDAGNLS